MSLKLKSTTIKLLIAVGVLMSILGYLGLLSQLCIENCTTSIITPISTASFFIGVALVVFTILFAIYQTGISKKLFWGGLVTACIFIAAISLAVKHKNTAYNQKLNACFSDSLKRREDSIKCN